MAKMTPHKRAVAITGEYQDRQGQTKKRYTAVGTLFQYDDGGFALKLDALPAGNTWNGFISFFDIEERDAKGGSRGGGSSAPYDFNADLDDPIPFATPYSVW